MQIWKRGHKENGEIPKKGTGIQPLHVHSSVHGPDTIRAHDMGKFVSKYDPGHWI